MATKRIHSLKLPSGQQDMLREGQFTPPKGKLLKAMILKCFLPIKNTTGGALAAGLNDAQKQAMLNNLEFNVWFGNGQRRQPIKSERGTRVHREARFAFNSEIEGYNDATTGLQRNMNNGVTTTCTLYLPIPLGRLQGLPPEERKLFGMGRSQCRTLQIEVKRVADAIAAGIEIDAAADVRIELYPDYESCQGDVWGLVPHWTKRTETGDEITFSEDGLVLRLSELSAIQSACALTNFDVSVDDEKYYEGVGIGEVTRELNDDDAIASAGLITDRETVLLQDRYDVPLRFRPTGKTKLRQNVKDLAAASLGLLYVPYDTEKEIKEDVQMVADKIREKTIRCTNAFLQTGLNLPKRIQGLPFYQLFDLDDSEFERAPGWIAVPGQTEPTLAIPKSFLALAKGKAELHAKNDESKAAANVQKEAATLVPGAIKGGRGTRAGFSPLINRISQMVK